MTLDYCEKAHEVCQKQLVQCPFNHVSITLSHTSQPPCSTDHRSRSEHCQVEAGTQEESRVLCVPGTSISPHLHTSLPPTWQKSNMMKKKWGCLCESENCSSPVCPCSLVFDCSVYVYVCMLGGVGPSQRKMKRAAFPNHLQRFCSSSSFFLIFNCFASSTSSFVLLGFFDTGCSPSSFFTVCVEKNTSDVNSNTPTVNHISSKHPIAEILLMETVYLWKTDVYLFRSLPWLLFLSLPVTFVFLPMLLFFILWAASIQRQRILIAYTAW